MKLSFEFFPPRTDQGRTNLQQAWRQLAELGPEYFSVTFGAGGTTQEGTFETVQAIRGDSGIDAAPHLSCIGSTRAGIAALLNQYREAGIRRIVALRGDLPSGVLSAGEFRFANELVSFIREEHGDWFHISVACYPEVHPQAFSADSDMENFVRKVEAGANDAITQYFFNVDGYIDFVDRARRAGVTIPIVPGIMPLTNYHQLARFSETCGAEIPRWIRKRFETKPDDAEAMRSFNRNFISHLCQQCLRHGADALHIYALNKAGPSLDIVEALRAAE